MPKYLFEASYKQEGLKGVASAGGSARREAIESMIGAPGAEWMRSTSPRANLTSS